MLIVDFQHKKIEADNHVIETYRTCEEKYRLTLLEHWKPQGTASALAFGIAMHAGRASYKRAVMDGRLGVKDCVEAAVTHGLTVWDKEQTPEMKEMVMIDDKRGRSNYERLLRGYLMKYGDPVEYKPLKVEIPGKQLLGTTPDGFEFWYIYTIDEVVEHKDRIWPVEFKTTSGFVPPDDRWFRQFNNKSSVTGYIWATEKALGKAIGGAIIHGMWVHAEPKGGSKSKYTLPDYFKMDYSYRDDDQISEWKHNTLLTGDDIARSIRENRWKRADGVPCILYDGCAMLRVCQATPAVRAKLLEMDYEKRDWNPWARLEN